MIGIGIGLWNNVAALGGGAATAWNPADMESPDVALSNGNLTATFSASGYANVRAIASSAKTTGKWYFEVSTPNGTSNLGVGVAKATATLTNYISSDSNGVGYYASGFVGPGTGSFSTWFGPHTIGVAVDCDAGKVWFAIDNTWQNSGNPSGGTGALTSALGTFYPIAGGGTGALTGNFTSASQTYAPPSGFSAWS